MTGFTKKNKSVLTAIARWQPLATKAKNVLGNYILQ